MKTVRMNTSMKIDVTEYHLRLGREMHTGESPQLRGFFGSAFADEVLLHHHQSDGSLVYKYPRVQFKILQKKLEWKASVIVAWTKPRQKMKFFNWEHDIIYGCNDDGTYQTDNGWHYK